MKKLLVILLILCLTVPFFASCEDTQETSSSVEEESKGLQLKTPKVDLGGREISILCHHFGAGGKSILGYTGEIIYAEENPSSVDDAKKQVLDYIETEYNCTIVGELVSDGTTASNVPDLIKKQVTSGLHSYDICFDSLGRASSLALEDMILDLNEVPNIDLNDEWWDQNAREDLSIFGKNFFACGDINTYDDQGTWCVLFNKTLKGKLGVNEDFYQLVKDDQWSFDKFVEICKNEVTYDSNGDQTLDEKDTWALGTETYNIYVHVVAAGKKVAEKDGDGVPYLTVSKETEETFNIIADVLEFYNDQQTVMVANAPPYTNKGFQNVWEETVHKAFVEGRELFYICGLINVASFRQMEDEFGILPMPKYYDTQDRYYHTVSRDNSSFMFLPATVPAEDLANIGTLISAIAEYSMHIVTPAYYDVQLKYRDSRDDESGEMLDLIFDSRTFDLGCAYNWGGIINQYMSMDKNIASRFESNRTSAEKALNDMLETMDFE
jgi:hypothetical protein